MLFYSNRMSWCILSKHRSHEDIVADILSIVRNEPKKTHIMYQANLSYALLCKYLDKLVEAQLIKYREMDTVFELTEKGLTYLDRYAEFEQLRTQLKANKSTLDKKGATLTEILGV